MLVELFRNAFADCTKFSNMFEKESSSTTFVHGLVRARFVPCRAWSSSPFEADPSTVQRFRPVKAFRSGVVDSTRSIFFDSTEFSVFSRKDSSIIQCIRCSSSMLVEPFRSRFVHSTPFVFPKTLVKPFRSRFVDSTTFYNHVEKDSS